ncbi:Protein of unknown function (DUF2985) domain containing protein [Naviculisporaceae sp. PSN 640]
MADVPPSASAVESQSENYHARQESIPGMVRRLSRELIESNPPEGFMAATSDIASSVVAKLKHHNHNQEQDQLRRSTSGENGLDLNRSTSTPGASSDGATITAPVDVKNEPVSVKQTEPFENGYHFPPKYSFKESTTHGLASFWKYFITPWGFFWTLYGLNVVAWGGMLFLLLCNAAPAMCYPTCDDIDSPRRKWVEWDSQVLTALFCVTAFGLAPWRFRDLYYNLRYRFKGDQAALRRLAGIHRSWFRLPGSQNLPVDVGPNNIPDDVPREYLALPENKTPDPPLTGTRAPPTPVWRMDYVIWCMVLNTLAQCALCGIMWGQNRYDRPAWSTGFLVTVGCVIAMVGGLEMFLQGKKVKSIEGVPCSERDLKKLASDREQGILHYNNLKAKKPKEKKKKKVKDVEADAGREKSGSEV